MFFKQLALLVATVIATAFISCAIFQVTASTVHDIQWQQPIEAQQEFLSIPAEHFVPEVQEKLPMLKAELQSRLEQGPDYAGELKTSLLFSIPLSILSALVFLVPFLVAGNKPGIETR